MSKIAATKESTNLLSESLELYYNSNLLDLKPVPNLKFRHFRLRLLDGYFYKVKRKLRSSEDLRKCLVENTPLDVYYSTATWLNPHLIASRLDSNILRNIYLSCDLSFDIDVSNKIKTLTEAKAQAVAVNDFIESKGFDVRYIAFSGSKGFHIVCDDPWKLEESELEPHKREMKAISDRKKLVQEASSAKILFDEKVTVDTRRIIRLPGTINSKTGYICTILSKKDLESDIETILKLTNHLDSYAPRIPQQREMTAPSASNIPGFSGRLGVRPRPEQNICYSLYYTNNIPETQLKIPILEFEGWTPKERLNQIIERTQRQYRLGSIYLFGDGEKFWAVSLKALTRRRVEKILGFSSSTNLYQCKKYGCTYTRIGKSIDVEGNTIQYEPKLIKIIESNISAQVSRTHHEFFSSLGINLKDDGSVLCGAGIDKLELVHAIIE